MNSPSGAPSPFDNSQPTADLSAHNPPNRHDPNATQPLPVARTSGSGRLSGGSVLGGLQSGTAAPVGSNVFDPPDDDAANPTAIQSGTATPRSGAATPGVPTGRLPILPMPTLIGLAAVAGALIVVLIPALMRRVIPTVPMNEFPAETAVRDPASPQAPAVTAPRVPQNPPLDASKSEAPAVTAPDDIGISAAPAEAGAPVAYEKRSVDANGNDPGSGNSDSGTDKRDRFAVSERKRSTEPARSTEKALPADADSDRGQIGEAWVHPRTGYAISPPQGFNRQRTGRRTIWRGPDGAQLLVETTTSPGASARADWESLDKALSKKYGRNYRSLGIRETTLAGRPAALWEFEISSKRGTTRKIDVAVHERGRGYAVLAEAPASRFDALRPQLEAAIASFQPPATTARNTSSRSTAHRDESDSREESDSHDESRQNARNDENDEPAKTRSEAREEAEPFSQPGY